MTTLRSGLLCASALAGLLAFSATPVLAQDAEVSEIVVTGSRIARKDYVSESPIVTVGQEQIAAVGMVISAVYGIFMIIKHLFLKG